MKKVILAGCILFPAMAGLAIAESQGQFLTGVGPVPLTAMYQQFNALFTGDWQEYGQLFTSLQGGLFPRLFLLVITVVPLAFFLHYVAIGPRSFPHDGRMIYCYNFFVRLVHWFAAISFSLLVLTGLLIIFAKLVGGGSIGLLGRNVHILSAIVFAISAVFMFLVWLKDMLPALYDLKWMIIMGGYLSKEIKPVPAGKFNAGQKMWFWLATVGGIVMSVTGYFLYTLQGNIDTIRLYAIIHNFLGAAMVAMFLVHVYMSIFAIKGALNSMFNGYKAEAELKILHSKFKY
ncbi:MAG: formate dehydrogenase subunit gamma [Desulfocapsa sp.]|nr:formate dehydrogenase subunit gamma [Desulfocapsa sp.]